MKMKTFFKLLFFLLAIFQMNISEAKVVVFESIISEATFLNVFNSEKSSTELPSVISENYFANTCKSESDLLDYRKQGLSTNANAAKTGANIVTKLAYVFGKATGSAHNIERSTGMLRQLESVGIFDNAAGLLWLQQIFFCFFFDSYQPAFL